MPSADNSNDDFLVSWKDIAAYLKCSVRKAQRLEKHGLPVSRLRGAKSVWASRSELERWLVSSSGPSPSPDPQAPVRRTPYPLPAQLLCGALGTITLVGSATSAYVWTIGLFALTVALLAATYPRLPDTRYARAFVGLFIIAGVSYTAMATAFPAVIESALNMSTLPPAPAYTFAAGLRFIPIPVLIWASLVVSGPARGDRGLLQGRLRTAYVFSGSLLLALTTSAAVIQSFRIWQAGLPIAWTLLAGDVFVCAVNLAMFVAGYRFFRSNPNGGYSRFIAFCSAGCLLIGFTAAITNRHWTDITRTHLDARNPVVYWVRNANAEVDFRTWVESHPAEAGRDLVALSKDPEFLHALRTKSFYRQIFDDTFQFSRKAVIFGYKAEPHIPAREPEFVLVRFPVELAETLRFESD